MSKEKQIKEMAKDMCDCCKAAVANNDCTLIVCDGVRDHAKALYNAGYRKQSEGKWVTSEIPQEKYVCSVCGGACWYYDYQGDVAKSRYCPNCGAKMKGGE